MHLKSLIIIIFKHDVVFRYFIIAYLRLFLSNLLKLPKYTRNHFWAYFIRQSLLLGPNLLGIGQK
jgi:hypothetical protein